MKHKDLIKRLELIKDAITAKGHPMQDYSSLKSALLDLLGIVREMLAAQGGKDASL